MKPLGVDKTVNSKNVSSSSFFGVLGGAIVATSVAGILMFALSRDEEDE